MCNRDVKHVENVEGVLEDAAPDICEPNHSIYSSLSENSLAIVPTFSNQLVGLNGGLIPGSSRMDLFLQKRSKSRWI
jgi:hypothetical protein